MLYEVSKILEFRLWGVPMMMNSLSVRYSFLPLWVARVFCIWNPSHICPSMSMLKVDVRFVCVCGGVDVCLLGASDVNVAV